MIPSRLVIANALKQFGHQRGLATSSTKLWGGRFEKDTDARAVNWAESLTCDNEMVNEDLWGSMAHVAMLGHQGIIPSPDAGKIMRQLLQFQDEVLGGRFDLFEEAHLNHDDVHMNIEARLIAALGMEVGGRMHTTRSRNDQVREKRRMNQPCILLTLDTLLPPLPNM